MDRFSPTCARGKHLFKMAGDFVEPLRALHSGNDSGLFTILVAVLDVLLLRYLGSDDLVVAGRHGGTETLLLGINLPDDPSFPDLLERVRSSIRNAPAERVSGKTLLILSAASQEEDSARYDLILAFTESEQGLLGSCEYNTGRLDETRARAMTKHFGALLKEAVTKPGARISSFDMFDAAEKHRILNEWNGEARGYLPDCVHELFEQQAEKTPDATAVIFEDSRLTYRELNRRANQLAHYLRRKGAGPEVTVGILMDASLEIIVVVVAILKAGGAYLALDQNQPAARLREIVRESRLSLAVTTAANPTYKALANGPEFVCLDLEASLIAAESTSNPYSGVTPDNMAVVRYTSGSTGKPKGAVTIHRSVTSRLTSLPLPDITATDVCLVNPSWGFGVRLSYPLALGATVVVLSAANVRDAGRLADGLERYGITSIFMVPSQLRQLLSGGAGLSSRLNRLRAVTVGGETLTADLAARFRELLPGAQLWNTYGGSELGGIAAMQPMAGNSLDSRNSIGRPVVNTSIYILDRDMNPAPPGAVGEMYVGSRHGGRGYLHRPDLTAPRFLPDPFGAGKTGGRLYRTGDLGRHLPDGRIEFLGRADRQVKVRGFRIELDEVQAVLHDHDQVHQAVVTAQETGSDNRLVAHVVLKAGASLGPGPLQSFLRQRLPDYMIPQAFVFLDRMPLNERGKVDTQALPAPGPGRPCLDSQYEAPRNPTEAAIAEIWSAVLGVDTVGINDNFIELGGDSLLATSVSVRLRNRFGLDIPMDLILEWSIATITAEIAAAEMELTPD